MQKLIESVISFFKGIFTKQKQPKLSGVTYYDILGIKRDSSLEDIEEAYKFLSSKYHPDKQWELPIKNKEKRFEEIVTAYNILSDPEKKKKYDKSIK